MQEIKDLIFNISDGSRAAHAFICEGMPGDARDGFIAELISGLLCTFPDVHSRPCGRCPSCRQVRAGTNMDVVRMQKSQGSSRTASPAYRTEDASVFTERLRMGAYGRFLIGLIDDADTLSETIQNKLLKTLEEPADNAVLLLAAANRDNLLSTVRSRCSVIRIADYSEQAREDELAAAAGDKARRGIAEMLAARAASGKHPGAGGADIKGAAFFHVFRQAADKSVKSREDALIILDILEDELLANMTGGGDPDAAAAGIEKAAEARMDIRREMQYAKALKRLYLEL